MAPEDAAELLIREARGVADLELRARSAGLTVARDVTVDAFHDGKPVCQLTVPAVVEGRAVFELDARLPGSVAQGRRESLAASVAMPVRFISAPLS
ncbi:MAG: hypothetical protein ACKORB_07650 [Opitutia bacterium]|jgi:hypothetical protein